MEAEPENQASPQHSRTDGAPTAKASTPRQNAPLPTVISHTALRIALSPDLVQGEEARLLLSWYHDGRIVAPNERAASFAREVLQQVQVEIDVVTDPGDDTDPIPGTPESPATGASESTDTTSKPKKPRKRLSAAGLSRAAKAWADKKPDQATALLWHNPAAVIKLIAPDALDSEQGHLLTVLLRELSEQTREPVRAAPRIIVRAGAETEILSGSQAVLRVATRTPAISDHDIDGEPISVLAAARHSFGRHNRNVGMLPPTPRVRVFEAPEDRLPDVPPEQKNPQLVLPTMQLAQRDQIGPAPWVAVFDRLGGQSMAPGVGAPLPLRLWIEALAWTPPTARDGRLVSVPLTVRDLRDALWPNGWRRGEQLPRLIEACRAVNGLAAIEIPERRSQWAPVLFREYPSPSARLSDPVLLEVRLPPVTGAGAGARFKRSLARHLGLSSAPEYRAYLGLVDLWDRTLRRGIRPTTHHSWPHLAPSERRSLVFGHDATTSNLSTLRTRQLDADRAFHRLEDAGVISLQRDRDERRWQIIRRDLPRN